MWCTPEILALRKLRQKNLELRLAWAYFTIKKKDDHKDIRVSKEVGKFIIRQSEKELHTHL